MEKNPVFVKAGLKAWQTRRLRTRALKAWETRRENDRIALKKKR